VAKFTSELKIQSPRYGTSDIYEILFTHEYMEIRRTPSVARCNFRERLDPEWVGDDLISILHNEYVYAPAILPSLFKYAWLSWRSGEINEEELPSELEALAQWLNEISRVKLSTDFWRAYL